MEQLQIDHEHYQRQCRHRTIEQLQYIIADCKLAIAAMPHGYKAGYYADEINYCAMELRYRGL